MHTDNKPNKEDQEVSIISKVHYTNCNEGKFTTNPENKIIEFPDLTENPSVVSDIQFWDYRESHKFPTPTIPFASLPVYKREKKTSTPGQKVCDRPCMRKVFKPLGTFAKCFGLFPCYDLTCVEKLNEKRVKVIHVLDYIYTFFVCGLMTTGAFMCLFNNPTILNEMKYGSEDTDYWVIRYLFLCVLVVY